MRHIKLFFWAAYCRVASLFEKPSFVSCVAVLVWLNVVLYIWPDIFAGRLWIISILAVIWALLYGLLYLMTYIFDGPFWFEHTDEHCDCRKRAMSDYFEKEV